MNCWWTTTCRLHTFRLVLMSLVMGHEAKRGFRYMKRQGSSTGNQMTCQGLEEIRW
jgi:hypothetical protein